MGEKVNGLAVHIGARIASTARRGDVWASGTVRFSDRGLHDLKGVPGEWRLYAAER